MQTEDLLARAADFIQENEELLEPDTSIHVLEAILIQGSEIGTELANEYKRAVDIAVPHAKKLEDAIRSKKVPPKQVAALDVEYNRAKREAEALNKELTSFREFLEKAQGLYHGQVDEDEQAVLEEMGVARPPDPHLFPPPSGVEYPPRYTNPTEPDKESGAWIDSPPKSPESRPYKPSFWRRLFGG